MFANIIKQQQQKMLFHSYFLVNALIVLATAQVTKVINRNIFLNRKKRYLAFPEKSNFAITMSLSKPLLQVQPKGFNTVFECDVPFPLPSDTRLYKKFKRNHDIQKREILTGLERAFASYGLNGNACVKRMICEARRFSKMEGKSLIKDFMSIVFKDSDFDVKYTDPCLENNFTECSMSFLSYIIGSFMP